jgi:hypothetical protein
MRWLGLVIFIGHLGGAVQANEANFTLRTQARIQEASESTLFPGENTQALFSALDTNIEYNGFRLAATGWFEKQGNSSLSKIELSELFYDFSVNEWQFSAGKKKIDWDVGYGYRPLDMFSPVDSLALYTAVSPGVWLVSGDWFTDDGTISILCNQTKKNYGRQENQPSDSWGCGGRYYQYFSEWEVQIVTHYDRDVKLRVGASALLVYGNALEFHGSILWQEKYITPKFYEARTHLDYFSEPVVDEYDHSAMQLLSGITYSNNLGMSFILEYWYDGRSPSHSEWSRFLTLVEHQGKKENKNPLDVGILSSEQRMYSSQNLFQHNVMLNIRAGNESWRPEVTFLLNPQDNGILIDTKVCYYWSAGHHIELGMRHFGGAKSSVYGQLEYDNIYSIGAEFVF